MKVYLEVVWLNNFFIDLTLLTSTLLIRRQKVGKMRILSASILGASVAVGYMYMPAIMQIAAKIALAPLMILPLKQTKKSFFGTLVVFVGLTYFLGGIIEGIKNLIGVDVRGYPILGLVFIGVLIFEGAVVYIVRTLPKLKRKICEVEIVVGGESRCARAICDSGNSLVDDYSGKPVVVVSKSFEQKFSALDNGKSVYEGFISVKTVNGENSLPLVKFDKVVVNGKEVEAYGALSGQNFDDCDLILQNTMF